MRKSRIIWIINENSLEGMELVNHFKSLGHIPTHIYTSREAYTRAKHEFPDIIILSPDLGDMNTNDIDLMLHLKQLFGSKEVPLSLSVKTNRPRASQGP